MTNDIIQFLKEKQNQLTKEALIINDCLINYDQGEAEYTKEEINQMCIKRDEKEQKTIFLSELIDELKQERGVKVYVISHCDQWHNYNSFRLIGVASEENLPSVLDVIQSELGYTDEEMDQYIDITGTVVDDI